MLYIFIDSNKEQMDEIKHKILKYSFLRWVNYRTNTYFYLK